MLEQSLVYLFSDSTSRRFVGCGVVVERSFILTCRHVWDRALASQGVEAKRAVVEYPYFPTLSGVATSYVELIETRQNLRNCHKDVVILAPATIPDQVTNIHLALSERYETGLGYAFAGLIGRTPDNPHHISEATIRGKIGCNITTAGNRQFSGNEAHHYWCAPGTSGAPVFRENGQHLVGIMAISEKLVNEGDNKIHEAYLIPAGAIRPHLEIARKKTRVCFDLTKPPLEVDTTPNMRAFGFARESKRGPSGRS